MSRDTGRNAGKAIRRNRDITFQALDRLEADPRFPTEDRDALDAFLELVELAPAARERVQVAPAAPSLGRKAGAETMTRQTHTTGWRRIRPDHDHHPVACPVVLPRGQARRKPV